MTPHHAGAHGMAHAHDTLGWAVFQVLVVLALVGAAGGYAVARWVARDRSPSPARRAVFWYAGLACAGAGLIGPLAQAARSSFTIHMVSHLLVGMLAPLLLVRAAPVTTALGALPVAQARALSRALRNRFLRVLSHPVPAAVLNAGGLWVLYTSDLFGRMHASTGVHAAVHVHVLLAGYLFTVSLVGVDPDPHRASMRLRSTVLIGFVAAHSVLAKTLYAHPPTGVDPAEARIGAQLMYYGGDAVDVTLMVLLFVGWYTATRPRTTSVHPDRRPIRVHRSRAVNASTEGASSP